MKHRLMQRNNKIKILYLITGLNIGGAEMVVRDLANGLNKEQFDVFVASITPLGDVGKKLHEDGIRVLSLEARNKFDPIIAWNLLKLLKKQKPDILHTHLFHADILGRVVGRIALVPKIITTIHNINIGGKKRAFLVRLTKGFSDYNIAVSEVVARNTVEKKMVKKLDIIYNGVELPNTKPFGKISNSKLPQLRRGSGGQAMPKQFSNSNLQNKTNKNNIVSVGSLTKQKGYKYLLEAAKLTNDKLRIANNKAPVKFIILGEGSEREALEKQIKDNNLEENVILKGNVNNVHDYLAEANFFVMPSLWEGFSIALLEAAVAGMVIIATDVGGNEEVIEDGINGFLVEAGNTDALADKIEYVLGLPQEERWKIGKNARKTIEGKFSIGRMIANYEKLYTAVTHS